MNETKIVRSTYIYASNNNNNKRQTTTMMMMKVVIKFMMRKLHVDLLPMHKAGPYDIAMINISLLAWMSTGFGFYYYYYHTHRVIILCEYSCFMLCSKECTMLMMVIAS